uniref:Uncharacterized protein n=1 Tax=Echinococcus granulosus TaxID=6210 RepID=A0A068WUM1_ECHGR|nr:hypothetical protein EgrG_000417000 [Echinococcus granulosus]
MVVTYYLLTKEDHWQAPKATLWNGGGMSTTLIPNSFEVSATPSDSHPSIHLTPVLQSSTADACLLQQPTGLSSTDGATVLFQQTTQSRQSR